MNADARYDANYTVGPIVIGPLFDQGYRYLVRGPGDADVGHFKTEEEAQRKVDALNREEPLIGGQSQTGR